MRFDRQVLAVGVALALVGGNAAAVECTLEGVQGDVDEGLMDFPLIGTCKAGWDLAEEFINMYTGHDGELFAGGTAEPNLQADAAMQALGTTKSLAAHMSPDFPTFDSTAASAEFEQGEAAIMNMWGSRAGSIPDGEDVVDAVKGNIGFAAAPTVGGGTTPASAEAGAKPYPMLTYVNLMHLAPGIEPVEFMQGSESAEKALKDVTAAYAAAAKEGGFL